LEVIYVIWYQCFNKRTWDWTSCRWWQRTWCQNWRSQKNVGERTGRYTTILWIKWWIIKKIHYRTKTFVVVEEIPLLPRQINSEHRSKTVRFANIKKNMSKIYGCEPHIFGHWYPMSTQIAGQYIYIYDYIWLFNHVQPPIHMVP
jgi:hypothetical protein